MAEAHPQSGTVGSEDALKLFCLGFVTLSLELVLIRYLAGCIYNLGYFPNLVLLGVFIGMGLGFLLHPRLDGERSVRVAHAAPWLLFVLLVLVSVLHPSMPGAESWMYAVGGELFFTTVPPEKTGHSLALFALWFVGVVIVFACLSQRTAKVFRRLPPLKAYTLDIAGSCAGIAAFTLASFLEVPAFAWFLVLSPFLAVGLVEEGSRVPRLLPVVPLVLVAALSGYEDTRLTASRDYDGPLEVDWSPYQKIELVPETGVVFANGVIHQTMHPAQYLARTYWTIPYKARAAHPELPPYKSVLVMGAGTGNDVAAALLAGAEHVDAVEIDPAIARIGREHHPAHPYDDPRVTLIVDDARAFLSRTTRRYDLVVFALTDSLVKVSSMSQLRLENYLFTMESFRRAYGVLTPTGDVVMYNFYRTSWLAEKLRRSLEEVAGKPPVLLTEHDDFKMFAAGPARPPGPASPFYVGRLDLPTDDWPFLYLRERAIPPLYLGIMGGLFGVIGAMLLVLRRLGRPSARAPRTPGQASSPSLPRRLAFLWMGAAFLLLETKSVVQFSLLFGTTWLNSSLVFFSVLVLVLLANWTAVWVRGRWVLPVAFGLLFAACAVSFARPLAHLQHVESLPVRFVAAGALTFCPIYFANIVFSVTFRDETSAEELFGWNLIGATVGGVIEYTSMALGYRALALLVAGFYAAVAVMLVLDRKRGALQSAPAPSGPAAPPSPAIASPVMASPGSASGAASASDTAEASPSVSDASGEASA